MKKIVSLLLVCAIALFCVSSLAEGVNSKGYVPYEIKGDVPTKSIDDLDPADKAEMEAAFNKVMDNIETALLNPNATLGDIFGKDIGNKLSDVLSEAGLEGFDVEALSIDDVQPVVFDAKSWDGESPVEMSFKVDLSAYKEGQQVIVLVGVINGSNIDWNPVIGVANADGGIDVEFPAELMEKIAEAGGKTTIAFGSAA